MIDALNRLLAPLRTRVANMVSRAVVRLVDDSLKVQNLQLNLLDEETRGGVERIQNYGFTSVPLDGAEAVALAVGGKRDHLLVVAVEDRRYRLKGLADGEVAVYDHTGSKVVFKANGDIQIVPSSGNVTVTGTLTASVDVVGGGKSLKNHTHIAGTSLLTGASAGAPVTGTTGAPT